MEKSDKKGFFKPCPPNLNLSMKLTALLLLVSIFSVEASVYSQKNEVTLDLERVETRKVLETIESLTDLKFFYNNKKIDVERLVSVKVVDRPVSEVLDILFEGTAIYYVLRKRQVILKRGAIKKLSPKDSGNRSSIIDEKVVQQSVSGTVTDANDAPLPGASIVEKGTTNGVTTDFDGNFSLGLADGNAVLVVSYIGFATKEVALSGQSTVNISLDESAAALDEIVVIGYGSVKKSDLTGAVSTVSEKDFNGGLVSSPDQLIQGKAAGVQVINNSGQPGGANTIRIRGNTSIRAGNTPLYVVDGIQLTNTSGKPGSSAGGISTSPPSNPLSYINPSDIASIQILKDASATAIYGSRGANGVVIITTKKGQNGEPTAEINSSFGYSVLASKPNILSASEYRAALQEYNLTNGDYGSDVDTFGTITRDVAVTNNQSIAIGSASERGSYRIALGYFDQEGIIKQSNFKRISANINGSYKFLENKKLGLDVGLILASTKDVTPPIGTSSGATGSLISAALAWNPTLSMYNPDGSIYQLGAESTNTPVALLKGYSDVSKEINIVGKFSPSYQITDNLLYKLDLGFTKVGGTRRGYGQRWVQAGNVAGRGFAYVNTLDESNTILTQTLNYTKDFGDKFNLNLLGGYEWQRTNFQANSISARDFKVDEGDYTAFLSSVDYQDREISSNYPPITELQSYFARGTFNFMDRYLLTASFRADGSNKFGENNKYGYFPSAAFAWNVGNEKFLENGPFYSLKLRLGFGKTGNQAFPNGAAGERWRLGTESVSLVNAPNPDLKWETTTSYNAGIDFGLIEGRLSGSIDYFNKTTSDLLFQTVVKFPGPEEALVWINIPGAEVINKGAEISLHGILVDKEKFDWDLDLNSSFVKNEVTKYNGAIDYGQVYGKGLSGVFSQRLSNGQPLNSFYLPVFTGTDDNGVDQFKEDSNNSEVKEFVGDANPNVILGISTSITAGKWNASLNFNGAFGHQLLYNTAMSVTNISNIGSLNIAKTQLGSNVANGPKASSKYIYDGDYLKLSNATISYDIGTYKSLKNIQVFMSGTNIFTISDYPGVDPEVNTVNVANGLPSSGIEYEAYPTVLTIMAGTKFSF